MYVEYLSVYLFQIEVFIGVRRINIINNNKKYYSWCHNASMLESVEKLTFLTAFYYNVR